ncbi:MAG: VTT domain-containing protein [bacterium]|nr:VTT domain-containing protein [bacterium]
MTATPHAPHAAPAPGAATTAATAFGPRRPLRKIMLLALVVGVALVVVNTPGLRAHVSNLHELKHDVKALGAAGALGFTVLAGALIALGVPRLWLCVPAGGLYGFWLGLLLTQCAALGGSYLTFLFMRWAGAQWAIRKLERHAVVRALTRNHTPFSVFMVRQLPIHGLVMNAALAASSVNHRDFLIGSFLGFLPQGIVVTLIGSGIGKPNDPRLASVQLLLALLCAAAVAVMIYRMVRSRNAPAFDA